MQKELGKYCRFFVKPLVAISLLAPGVATATPAYQAKLEIDNGILVGAKGVLVDGVAYDVAFQDGTCESVYGSCLTWKLPFPLLSKANQASQALADQVFLDSAAGKFDSNPALTRGCSYADNCLVFTPYYWNSVFSSSYLVNIAGAGNNGVLYPVGYDMPDDFDSRRASNVTIARWTVAAVDVPEPGSLALLFISLAALAGVRLARRIANR